MLCPCIKKINLADNELDVIILLQKDSSIAYLCYYLEKGNRVELKELNLSGNNFGKMGKDAIKGLMARFENLHVIY